MVRSNRNDTLGVRTPDARDDHRGPRTSVSIAVDFKTNPLELRPRPSFISDSRRGERFLEATANFTSIIYSTDNRNIQNYHQVVLADHTEQYSHRYNDDCLALNPGAE